MSRILTARSAAILGALVVAAGLATASAAGATTIYNDVAGFTGGFAPGANGVWSYGTGQIGHTGEAGNFQPLAIYEGGPCVDGPGVACYQSSQVWDRVPLVAKNIAGAPVAVFNTVVQPVDVLNVHPGPYDNDAVVRFTAAAAGTYNFSGFFQTLDNNPHGVTVGIYDGDTKLFGQEFLGAAANLSTLTAGGKLDFSGQQYLAAGQSLDFIVNRHFGNDDSYYNDSTGLSLNVQAVPEPASWALMLLGFGGLGAALRRRRAAGVVTA